MEFIPKKGLSTTRAILMRKRESLKKISDSYPKLILTLDDDPAADFDGISRINALDWLIAKA